MIYQVGIISSSTMDGVCSFIFLRLIKGLVKKSAGLTKLSPAKGNRIPLFFFFKDLFQHPFSCRIASIQRFRSFPSGIVQF